MPARASARELMVPRRLVRPGLRERGTHEGPPSFLSAAGGASGLSPLDLRRTTDAEPRSRRVPNARIGIAPGHRCGNPLNLFAVRVSKEVSREIAECSRAPILHRPRKANRSRDTGFFVCPPHGPRWTDWTAVRLQGGLTHCERPRPRTEHGSLHGASFWRGVRRPEEPAKPMSRLISQPKGGSQ